MQANKWLIITTDFQEWQPRPQHPGNNPDGTEVETNEQYHNYLTSLQEMSPNIKCLRRCWWQDEHTPSAVMGQYPSGGRHLSQVTTRAEWDTNKARLDTISAVIEASPNNPAALPSQFPHAPNTPNGVWYQERENLREFFHRFPQRDSMGVLP